MRIKTSPSGLMEDYTFILSRPDHTHIGQLSEITDQQISLNMTGADEISFTYHKPSETYLASLSPTEAEQVRKLWDELTDFKYIYVRELDEYFSVSVSLDEKNEIEKRVSGNDASGEELSNSMLYGLEINTETDISRDDYADPTIFYDDVKPSRSLLHRALEKVPQWSVDHVDTSLRAIQRTFTADDTDLYSFLTETVATEVGCLFVFNSVYRTISAYDLKTVCSACGHRGEFSGKCPECGSNEITTYGTDTGILIDVENLAESITYSVDTDSVKNTFKLIAGDDDMTAAIRNINPNGSDYIYYFSEQEKHDMPEELVVRMNSYDSLLESKKARYKEITAGIYESIDKVLYFTSGMMPKVDFTPITAKDQIKLLADMNMSEMGVNEVRSSMSVSTADNAIKQYASLYVRTGWYKVDIVESTFNYLGKNELGRESGVWRGKIKISAWATMNEKKDEDKDEAISGEITVTITDDLQKYIDQKVKKHLKEKDDTEDGSVYDVLVVDDLTKFEEYIAYYGLRRLESFADALQGCMDILIQADQATPGRELYDFYTKYVNKLDLVRREMDRRKETIDFWTNKYDRYIQERADIQEELNFQDYLGEELYKVFCVYKKEQTYSNENFIVDSLDDKEILNKAEQFYQTASEELYKSAEHQHHIESTLHNLLTQPEFQPLIENFEVGNYIRAKIDGKVYKLRLIKIGLNSESKEDIEVEFSDVLKLANGVSDLASVIQSAKQVASTYDITKHQIKKNAEQSAYVRDFVNRGFDLTTTKILNSRALQETVIDKSGIWMKSRDDFTDQYDPCQVRMISNGLYFTDDAWRSVKAAFGKYHTVDPKTGKEMTSYGLLADTIVGRLIIGEQLGLYSNDGSAEMSFDDRGLILNTKDNGTGVYKNIFSIEKDGNPLIWVDNQGSLKLNDKAVQLSSSNETIDSQFGQISNLYVKNETISHLFSNSITGQDAVILNLTAKNAVLGDATIAEAIIQQLNAGLINAAYINTDFVQIGNTDKDNFLINGSTMQIVDDNKQVRVQIGKDQETGEYSYWLWNNQGNLIWNPEGITEKGVPDLLLKNDKIAEGAMIHGSKLDIPSVAQKLNDDGSITMDISHVKVDGSTLDVQFGDLTTKVTDHENTLKTQGASLKVLKDSIDNKVWNEDIKTVTDEIKGDITTINNQYTQVTQTLTGVTQSVTDFQAQYAQDQTNVTNRFNTISDTVDSHSQSIGEFTTRLSTIDEDFTEMSSKYNDVKDTLDGHTQEIGDVKTSITNAENSITQQGKTITEINGTVLKNKETLEGFGTSLETLSQKTEEDIQKLNDQNTATGQQINNINKQVTEIQATQGQISLSVSSMTETLKKTIKKVQTKYLVTSNNTMVPNKEDTGWSDNPSTPGEGQYLWSMTVTTYTDDTVEKKTPICTTDKGQDACFLRIDSSEGAIFRNGQGATKLTVTVVNGRESITTIAGLRAKFGNGVKIVWKEKKGGQISYQDIPANDSRISNDGFTLTISATQVLGLSVFRAYVEIPDA